MKSVNLYLLTRIADNITMSLSYAAFAELPAPKLISTHEAASMYALCDLLTQHMPSPSESAESSFEILDGFFFSYVIEHIGKEFDLLKISSDGGTALNIELKSEDIGEDRIKKQLEQNRYYLAHAAHTIYSFTFVMETGTLYLLHEKGYLRAAEPEELLQVLRHPALADCLAQDPDQFFRSSDYLIFPVNSPEKYLQRQYFLTNQQFDFKRKILVHLKSCKNAVISISGIAGTGKTLLLYDLALELSKGRHVMFIHCDEMREGHRILTERLKYVNIISAKEETVSFDLAGYSYLLIDMAGQLPLPTLQELLDKAAAAEIPVIATYDPHTLLKELCPQIPASPASQLLESTSTLSLSFSGNIRINTPIYSFLRTLLYVKEHAGQPDYSCIDILYAGGLSELRSLVAHFENLDYERIERPERSNTDLSEINLHNYKRLLMVLNSDFSYDETGHLRASIGENASLRLLYEGLSRTRERLCLIIYEQPELYAQILRIKLHFPQEV